MYETLKELLLKMLKEWRVVKIKKSNKLKLEATKEESLPIGKLIHLFLSIIILEIRKSRSIIIVGLRPRPKGWMLLLENEFDIFFHNFYDKNNFN